MNTKAALLASALLLFTSIPAAHAQAPSPVEDRRKALSALFQQYWDANLENSPEFASSIGDKRFNDRLSDYSVKAQNAWIER